MNRCVEKSSKNSWSLM